MNELLLNEVKDQCTKVSSIIDKLQSIESIASEQKKTVLNYNKALSDFIVAICKA